MHAPRLPGSSALAISATTTNQLTRVIDPHAPRLQKVMPLLVQHDPLARWLIGAAAVSVVAGEVVATYLGRARDAKRDGLDTRGRGGARRHDRGTRLVVALAAYLSVAAAVAIAKVPGLRVYANNWLTLGLGIGVVLAGAALRDWAILSLGRYFRRTVTIEPGQHIVRRGPYRVLRHPSYAGLALIFAGFGLAFGSWVSATVALVVALLGLLPRILVEEHVLAQAFGPDYADYARSTARVVPHVW